MQGWGGGTRAWEGWVGARTRGNTQSTNTHRSRTRQEVASPHVVWHVRQPGNKSSLRGKRNEGVGGGEAVRSGLVCPQRRSGVAINVAAHPRGEGHDV